MRQRSCSFFCQGTYFLHVENMDDIILSNRYAYIFFLLSSSSSSLALFKHELSERRMQTYLLSLAKILRVFPRRCKVHFIHRKIEKKYSFIPFPVESIFTWMVRKLPENALDPHLFVTDSVKKNVYSSNRRVILCIYADANCFKSSFNVVKRHTIQFLCH